MRSTVENVRAPSSAPGQRSSTRACDWRPSAPTERPATTGSSGTSCVPYGFSRSNRGALILGPVGVGKTHLATALGHIAIRRRHSVVFSRADQLFRRLKAARLDNSLEAEMRKLARIDVLILDDFALQAMDSLETADFYELVVERHQRGSTIITSNRDPSEWIGVMSDPLLAQSAIDRLVATSYELVVEGQSYRRQQRPRHANQAAS